MTSLEYQPTRHQRKDPTVLERLKDWFTPGVRQSIQVFFGSLAPLAILIGIGSDGIWEQSLIILGAILQFVSSGLSLLNLKTGGIARIWAVLRGSVYALAATVSPALVLLGFYDQAFNAVLLSGLSLALGALSNLIAIWTGKQQQVNDLQDEIKAQDVTIRNLTD